MNTDNIALTKYADSFNVELGKKLKEVRRSRGAGQKDISFAMGISPQQLSKYENGHVDSIAFKKICIFAKFFNISLLDLIP